jgi:hypothetical protein
MLSVGGLALTRLGRGGMFAKLISPNIGRFRGVRTPCMNKTRQIRRKKKEKKRGK